MKHGLSKIFYIYILLFFWINTSCKESPAKHIRILSIQGSEVSSSKFLWNTFQALDSTGYVHIPVQEGDFIGVGNFSLCFGEDFPDSIGITTQDSLLFINGELWGINFSELTSRQDIQSNLLEIDFNHLRNVILVFPMEETERYFLSSIKDLQNQINILINNKDTLGFFNKDLQWLAANFQTKSLTIDEVPDSLDFEILKSMKNLEFLGLGNISISLQQGILPPLPQVKSLFLYSDEDSFLNFDFYSKNKHLERLIAVYPVGTEIHVLKNLKELSIFYPTEYFPPYNFALRHPNLESLDFPNLDFNNFDDLKGLERLKWYSFQYSGDSLGLDLIDLAKIQPHLKLLSISQAGYRSMLANHSALRDFSQLEYLLIQDELFGVDSVIMEMSHLKYLSMPYEFLEDSLNLEALQKALPNTVISSNSGFCLGSGWILILLPLSVLGFWFQKLFFRTSLGKNEG